MLVKVVIITCLKEGGGGRMCRSRGGYDFINGQRQCSLFTCKGKNPCLIPSTTTGSIQVLTKLQILQKEPVLTVRIDGRSMLPVEPPLCP